MNLHAFDPARLDPQRVTRRRLLTAGLVLLFLVPATTLLVDVHRREGFTWIEAAHTLFFVVLFGMIAFGAAQAILGYLLRRRGGDPQRIVASLDENDITPVLTPTAIVMPICNEEVGRVMEGVRAMYESLVATGELPHVDFFLLSDTQKPDNWIEEEASWLALTQRLGAQGRIFYRKRRVGINKKAGNLADFCRRWGRHYRYMVVLDADSIMSGDALVKLVRLMERNPGVGIVQAVPLLANGETVLARLQQFASRLYGPVFATGLNYWQQAEANYWGHNAIIRVQPFIRHCSLPELPGDGPFGGRILSHDYVEAALMRRAGWQVWLATDLEGNYEECPANLIDFAKRDRRWLQGNLQHARLIVARGFYAVNRLHFTLGILSYLSSPLWLAFLLFSTLIARQAAAPAADGTATFESAAAVEAGASHAAGSGLWFAQSEALVLFTGTLLLLFLPKVIALLDLARRKDEVAAFGGWSRVLGSVVLETVIYTLLAPILMAFHTKFVVLTLARQSVGWGTQRRGHAGASAWAEAVSAHAGHTLAGLAGAALVTWIDPLLALWMSPVLAGLILSIPLSYATGSLPVGLGAKARGWFLTPEETAPDPVLLRLTELLAARRQGTEPRPELEGDFGLLQAVLDPYVNAVHVALLRAKDELPPATEERFAALRARLLQAGPEALSAPDKVALMMDVDSMNALHHDVWSTPAAQLAEWWQLALQHYGAGARAPATALQA